MPSRKLGMSIAAGVATALVVGGGALAIVGPETLHQKLFGEHDEGESIAGFVHEHPGLNRHSQAIASIMEKLDGGEEAAYGPNQMIYEDNAFPRSAIGTTQTSRSFSAFAAKAPTSSRSAALGRWTPIPNTHGTVPGEVTYTGQPSHVSGRATSIVVSHNGRTVYIGTAGGGVWKTADITAAHPSWHPIGGSIPSQAIGSLAISHGVLYVGTGDGHGLTAWLGLRHRSGGTGRAGQCCSDCGVTGCMTYC